MKRKITAFLLMLLMIVSLCSCGGKQGDGLFDELKGNRFVFASGAGAWGTELTIDDDGSFKGQYHDSDMGSTGDGYPNGTRYYSEFNGQFSEPEKVNEYTYKIYIFPLSFQITREGKYICRLANWQDSVKVKCTLLEFLTSQHCYKP